MAEECKTETKTQRFWRFLNEIKVVAGAMVLLPFFGAHISSVIDWGQTIYNINPRLSEFTTKSDSISVALDVLLFIEPAIRDDIVSLEFTIDDMVKRGVETAEEESLLIELRRQYKAKILELDRIRARIRNYKPEWTPEEEKEK